MLHKIQILIFNRIKNQFLRVQFYCCDRCNCCWARRIRIYAIIKSNGMKSNFYVWHATNEKLHRKNCAEQINWCFYMQNVRLYVIFIVSVKNWINYCSMYTMHVVYAVSADASKHLKKKKNSPTQLQCKQIYSFGRSSLFGALLWNNLLPRACIFKAQKTE